MFEFDMKNWPASCSPAGLVPVKTEPKISDLNILSCAFRVKLLFLVARPSMNPSLLPF